MTAPHVNDIVSPQNMSINVIDGEPVECVNIAGLAQLVPASPLGTVAALGRMRDLLPERLYRQLLAAMKNTPPTQEA